MSPSRRAFSALLRLLLVFFLLAGILPARASSASALYLLEISSTADLQAFAALDYPILGQLYPPASDNEISAGHHYLLAVLSPSAAAASASLKPRLLDADTSGAAYYLLTAKGAFSLPTYTQPLYQDSRQAVARLTEAQAQSLAQESRLFVRRLQAHPLALEKPAANYPSEITPLPVVQEIIDQVASSAVSTMDGNLSGESLVTIGGAPYQILTRYSRTTTPIEKATQYAYELFQEQGLAASYHAYNLPSSGERRNVIAEQPGLAQPERIFLITAHLDSTSNDPYNLAPGADDNASGSTAVLLASEILSNYLFDCTLRYVLFTGEEQGLYGSEAYAQDAFNRGDQIEAVLNLDMIGYNSDADLTFELHTRPGNDADLAIANLFADVIEAYSLPLSPIILQDGVQYSDHASFWQYGYPAIIGIEHDLDFTPYYHTVNDTLDTLDLDYFTAAVKAALATFSHMGCLVSETGTLAGRVTDYTNGAALPGALVEVTSGSLVEQATTNTNGRYSLTLGAGTYTVTISAPGYYPVSYTGIEVQTDTTTTQDAVLVRLAHYTLSGVVQDAETGLPLEAALTVLEPVFLETTSDPLTGAYTLTLPGGVNLLQVSAEGYETQTHTVLVSGDQAGYDLFLQPACQLLTGLDWSYNPLQPYVHQTVEFSAAVQGGETPVTYTWNFGDNSPPLVVVDQSAVSHVFPVTAVPQAYPVTLSAVNACGVPLQSAKSLTVLTHALYMPVTIGQP